MNILKKKSKKVGKVWTFQIKPNFLTQQQLQRFLSVIRKPRDRVFFILLAVSGRRVSEVLAIRPLDCDWDNSGISFDVLKKRVKMKQFTPIDKYTMELLKEYVQAKQIYPYERIFSFDRTTAYRKCIRYSQLANLDKVGGLTVHPHTFRHTFVREQMVLNNNNMKLVADLINHSSTRVTELYLNYTSNEFREARDKLGSLVHKPQENN